MRLIVCPERHLPAAFDLSGPARLLTLRSPAGEHAPLQDARVTDRLVLEFNDIDGAREGLTPPGPEMIAALLAYGAALPVLVVQCFAGVSRSTAAAYALACQAAGPGAEGRLAADLRRLSPAATPNPLMVSLADRLLSREGRMVEAIAAIGRGAQAFEGPVFDWRIPAHAAGD